jgi:hypothetical protein
MAVVTQIQIRRGTAAQWTSTNPTLASGEQGYETDTGKMKIGDGSTAWNSLAYAITGAIGTVTSVTAGTGLSGGTITSTGTIAIDSTVATLTGSQILTNKTLTAPIITLATNAQTATYTLALTDASDIVEMNVASANNLTIPLDSSVAFAIGTVITILQTGTGQTTINPTGGVTVNGTPGLKLRAQWSSCTLVKRATDTWVAMGDLSA